MNRVRLFLENRIRSIMGLTARKPETGLLVKRALVNGRVVRLSAVLIALVSATLLASPITAEAQCTSNATGTNWNSATHWSSCGGLIPQNGDAVVIATATILNTNTNSIASLTINTGITLTIGDNNTDRTVTVTGNVSVNGTGSLVTAGNGGNVFNIGGDLATAGTFDAVVGGATMDVTFTGTTQAISGAGAIVDFNNITINSSSTVTLSRNVSVAGNVTVSGVYDLSTFTSDRTASGGTFTVAGGATLKIGGTNGFPTNFTTAVFNSASTPTSTVEYNGSSQSLRTGTTYGNLTLSGSGTKTAAAALTVGGNIGVGVLTNGSGITLSGTSLTLGGSAAVKSSVNNGAITTSTDLTVTGTGNTLTNNGTISVTGNLGGTGNLTQGTTGILNDNDDSTTLGTFTASAVGNTVNYNRSGAQTVVPTTYYNLTLSGTSAKTTTSTTVNGVLSMEGTATASVAPTYGASATLQYNTATARTSGVEWITPFVASGGIIIANTGTITPSAAKTLNSTAPLTINSSATLADGGLTLTVKGNISNSGTHSGAGKILLTGGSAAHALTGSGGSYRNLELDDLTNGAALTGTATIAGNLALTAGDITVTTGGSNTLFMGLGSTSSGVGDVVGKVNRTDNGPFGNQNVIITKTVGTVTSFDVTLVKGTSSLQTGVKRVYVITPNGGSIVPLLTATLRLRYLDSERNNNSENTGAPCNLQLWKETGTTWAAQGSTDCKATDDNNRWVELTGVASFSPWTIAGLNAPTACKLEGFQAARSDDGVVLEWRTGYEVNNVGFNVYRQGSDGEMVKLTKHMVAGSGLMVRKNTALTSGLSYYWSDPDTKKGDHPQYWLEDLDADGHTSWNGPFVINEAAVPTRPTPGGKAAPGEKGGRGDANSMTINSISEETEQSGAYQPSGPVESTAKVGKMKLAAVVQQSDLAGKPAVKISINREGWYRITQAQLVAAGISTSTDVKKLQLFVDSQEIPIIVGGNGRGFDPTVYIEFYGQGLDTPSTDTRVYWLIVGANGQRIKTFTGLSGGSAGDSFPYTVQRKDRLFYRSEIQNGDAENFFGAFIYYQPTDQALTVNKIAPAANTTLEIALQGFNAGPHQVQVSLNGAIVGTLSFNDRVRQVFTLTAPQALLTEGANKVTLQAVASNSDFSFVDYIKLTYAHKFEAENNSLRLTAPGSSSVTLNGFTGGNIRIVDVTDPKAVQELLAKPSQDNTMPTSITVVTLGGGTRTLLAFVDTKQAAKVAANKPSSLRQSSNQADLVIIGAGDFSSSLQSLQSLRQGQGIQTMLVDVEDVYDEFSFGQKSPNALKDFLSYARTNWKKAPKYVLLGGMASFDPRNYMGLGNTDFVPTKIVMTEHLETASDDWFVDFNNDGMPEMALGRLPARNANEAARMVQKLVNYDQAASGAGVLLVADVNKGFDFEHNNDLLKSIVPGTTAVQDIRRASDPQAHQNLINALNQGKKLVNYTGHGSVDIWEASLLTSTDAAGLANAQKLSLVVAMTCLNGYFFDERFESLAHALVNAQNGGAVGVWSSTGLTEPDPQSLADQELFRQLFAGASVRLGDAALKAKAAITDSDVRRTWVLIGDPTMRFKQ